MPRPLQHLDVGGLVRKACFMRMDSHACPDARIFRLPVVFVRQPNAAVGGLWTLANSNREISFDAVLFRARQHLGTIDVVALAFEMGVRVDEHRSLVAGR
jgi:hypothetical protein